MQAGGEAARVSLGPEDDLLAVSHSSKTEIELYAAATGKLTGPPLAAHSKDKTLRTVAFSPDGRWLVSTGQANRSGKAVDPGEVIVWDVRARAKHQEWTLPLPNPQCGAVFAADNRHVLTATSESVYILRVEPRP